MITQRILNLLRIQLSIGECVGIIPFKISDSNRKELHAIKSSKLQNRHAVWEIFNFILSIITTLQIHSALLKTKTRLRSDEQIWNLIVIAYHGYVQIITIGNALNLRAFCKEPNEWTQLLNNLWLFGYQQKKCKLYLKTSCMTDS